MRTRHHGKSQGKQQRDATPRMILFQSASVVFAFYVGSIYGASSSVASCPGIDNNAAADPLLVLQRGTTSHSTDSSTPYQPPFVNHVRFAPISSSVVAGMGQVSRNQFLQTFDSGIPWDQDRDDEDVLILYPKASRRTKDTSTAPLHSNMDDALHNCSTVKVVLVDDDTPSTCLAVVRQYESYHIQKWVRQRRRQRSKWMAVSRFAQEETGPQSKGQQQVLLEYPPKPVSTRTSFQLLHHYLSIYEEVLEELKPLAEKVAASTVLKRTVTVMVCNERHLELLMNYCCAAKAIGMDLSSILLFAVDSGTRRTAELLGLTAYYHPQLFSFLDGGDAEYGTMEYARIMLSKVYSVHLISSLGYDFLFQDVDLVPYRADYLQHFVSSATGNFDLYFQDDHNQQPQYAPWSANSGFYYARNNVRTRYFFAALVRSTDLILRSKSHQAVVAALLAEQSSLFGLRVKTMHEHSRDFPVGYHFHKDWTYMKDMIESNIKPYVFHMNWNNDKETKKKFNQQLGNWFVKDGCVSGECCAAETVVVCHFRDKPSKIPCHESIMIEEQIPFW